MFFEALNQFFLKITLIVDELADKDLQKFGYIQQFIFRICDVLFLFDSFFDLEHGFDWFEKIFQVVDVQNVTIPFFTIFDLFNAVQT